MPSPVRPPAGAPDCTACPLSSRRGFLRDAAGMVGAAVLALGGTPRVAGAMSLRMARAVGSNGDERTYPLPATDGATIDKDAEVILMRYQGHVYAFGLACPHQHTALRWEGDEARFQCPKHHSRYRPDGVFISGRATRNMDRYAIRRSGATVVVDLAQLYRDDTNATAWDAATIPV